MNEITVAEIEPHEISEALTVLSQAFLTQPNMIALWRKQDESVRQNIETMFRIAKLERSFSKVLVARGDSQILGVLNMAEWPHCQLSPIEILKLLPRLFELTGTALPRLAKIQFAWGKHDPRQQHWHLGPIGVLPTTQGQGIGSRMLERCCEFIDQRKEAAYLETDRPPNVPFYERFGFTVTGEETILGVPNWFMWRAPR